MLRKTTSFIMLFSFIIMVIFTKEMSIALALTIVLFVATINQFAPLEYFVKLNKSFNSYWIAEFKKDSIR